MEWLLVGVAVVLLGVAAVVAAGKLGSMPPADNDVPAPDLPEGPLSAADLRQARFGVVMRGYEMQQVDALIERLAQQLEAAGIPLVESVRVGEPAAQDTTSMPITAEPVAVDPDLSSEAQPAPLAPTVPTATVVDPAEDAASITPEEAAKVADVAGDEPGVDPVHRKV